MAIDASGITLTVTVVRHSRELLVEWTDARDPGTLYQVYCDGTLFAVTDAKRIVLPPGNERRVIQVGAIASSEVLITTPPATLADLGSGARPQLTWYGGTYQKIGSESVDVYEVFRGDTAGAAVNYSSPVASVRAWEKSSTPPGFGRGGFGQGGFGNPRRRYTWQDAPLTSGTWNYAIRPKTASGVVGTATTAAVAVTAPPRPIPYLEGDPYGRRITHTTTGGVPTLSWAESPDHVDATNEIQTIGYTSGAPTSGSFFLELGGGLTSAGGTLPLAGEIEVFYNETASSLATKINDASMYRSGAVSVTGGPYNVAPLVVEFIGVYAGADIRLMTYSNNGLGGGTAPSITTTQAAVAPGNEVQFLYLNNATAPSSGNWKPAFADAPGFWGGTVDWDCTAAELQTAIEAIGAAWVGNVLCDGGPMPLNPIRIQFVNSKAATNVALLTVQDSLAGLDLVYAFETIATGQS